MKFVQQKKLICSLTAPKSKLWKNIFLKYMKRGRNRSNVTFVTKVFSQKGNLTKHTASVQDSNKSFKCDICDHNFSQKANLKIHIAEIHEGKKVFECHLCKHSCTQNVLR